jgi:hypothetical protein
MSQSNIRAAEGCSPYMCILTVVIVVTRRRSALVSLTPDIVEKVIEADFLKLRTQQTFGRVLLIESKYLLLRKNNWSGISMQRLLQMGYHKTE